MVLQSSKNAFNRKVVNERYNMGLFRTDNRLALKFLSKSRNCKTFVRDVDSFMRIMKLELFRGSFMREIE